MTFTHIDTWYRVKIAQIVMLSNRDLQIPCEFLLIWGENRFFFSLTCHTENEFLGAQIRKPWRDNTFNILTVKCVNVVNNFRHPSKHVRCKNMRRNQ